MTLGLFKRGLMQGARFGLWRGFLRISMVVATLVMSLMAAMGAGAVRAQAGGNQAGLVVVHGDGRVATRCVAFSEAQISGADLVFRSGLSLVSSVGPLGLMVCSLNGEGCPSTDCFCECHGTPCVYWNYYTVSPDGLWSYANTGAMSRQITNGDVDAWLWGESSQLPPGVTFDEICGQGSPGQAEPVAVLPPVQDTAEVVQTATPTPTETAGAGVTATATPSPTPEVVQTATPAPTERAGAGVTPTATPSPRPEAAAIAVVATSTPGATGTARPTATPSAAPRVVDFVGDGSVVSDVAAPATESALLAEAAGPDVTEPSDSPSTGLRAGLVQGRQGQIVAFVGVLSIVGGAFALLSRRPGGRRSRAK